MSSLNFSWPVTVYLYEDFLRLSQCMQKNRNIFNTKDIVVFGAGIRGSLFCKLLKDLGYNDFTYVDNNKEKWGGYISEEKHQIYNPATLLNNKDNKVVLVSIENMESVEQQLLSYGYTKDKNLFYIITDIYNDYILEMTRPYSGDILIMGDCGFSQISVKDVIFDSLGQMLKDKIGEEHLKVLGMHGMGMRSFYHIFKQLLNMGQIPKKFLLMTNFEVFTKMHHLLPRTQHSRLFSEMINKLCVTNSEFLEYAEITKKRSEQIYGEAVEYNEQMTDNNARLFIKMNYMYKFSERTEDAVYFVKIMELASFYNVELIPFIPPVNYEFAQQCYDNFRERYDMNIVKLSNLIDNFKLDKLDTSYFIKSTQFADLKTIDESCNYEGRRIIFDIILKTLNNN